MRCRWAGAQYARFRSLNLETPWPLVRIAYHVYFPERKHSGRRTEVAPYRLPTLSRKGAQGRLDQEVKASEPRFVLPRQAAKNTASYGGKGLADRVHHALPRHSAIEVHPRCVIRDSDKPSPLTCVHQLLRKVVALGCLRDGHLYSDRVVSAVLPEPAVRRVAIEREPDLARFNAIEPKEARHGRDFVG